MTNKYINLDTSKVDIERNLLFKNALIFTSSSSKYLHKVIMAYRPYLTVISGKLTVCPATTPIFK